MRNSSLVSCLCISWNRPQQLRDAINYYKAQTYLNKELVIVSAEHSREYEEVVASFADESIRYFGLSAQPELSLGELRNLAIEKAAGEYICIWDDDDWYHYRRIEIQMKEALRSKKAGSILTHCIIYDAINGEAYLSSPAFLPPASILCRKGELEGGDYYPAMNKAEDIHFLLKLMKRRSLFPLINPILYIYIYHKGNTWGEDHFARIFKTSQKLSGACHVLIRDTIGGKYSCEKASKRLGMEGLHLELDYFFGVTKPVTSA